MKAAEILSADVGVAAATRALGVSRATLYRRRLPPPPAAVTTPRASPRALLPAERESALAVLHSPEFVDRAPAEIVATLLDQNRYVGSERTLYRLLEQNGEVRERRDQRLHPPRAVPRLCAKAPKQVWSWDITPLPGAVRGLFFHLYVMLDLFSRYAVAWMVAPRQTAALAVQFVEEACRRQGIRPGTLIAHQDRGAPMTSRSLALLYETLGVAPSFSRPRVSDDNAYSESQFKTVKYHPSYPGEFRDEEHARRHFAEFFPWYNDQHRHGGIAYLTPADVHFGRVEAVVCARQATLDAAFAAHPERFSRGRPVHPRPSAEVWINPPLDSSDLANPTCPESTGIENGRAARDVAVGGNELSPTNSSEALVASSEALAVPAGIRT